MTEPAILDETARRAMLLLALRRLMDELFGDLLMRDDVANVLVLPPLCGQRPCRVVVKNGPAPEFVRAVDPDQVRRFLAYVAGFARKELRRDRPTLDVTLPESGERRRVASSSSGAAMPPTTRRDRRIHRAASPKQIAVPPKTRESDSP